MPSAPPEKMGPSNGKPSALPKGPRLPTMPGADEELDEASIPPSHSRASIAPIEPAPISIGPDDFPYDEPARSQEFATGRMLDIDADPELQCLVEAAASGVSFPIAAVSIVFRSTHILRAHVGLPSELDESRVIERSLLFCRTVVERDAPLVIDDVATEPLAAREIAERLGFRAFVGLPLRAQGKVIGTLFLIDTEPRSITDAELARLERVAALTARRLVELSGKAPTPGHLISHAAEPAFAEIRTLLSSIVANAAFGRMVVSELEPLVERLASAAQGLLAPEDSQRALAQVPHAVLAHRELTIAFAELDGVSKKLIDTVSSLEKTVAARTTHAHSVGETIEAATVAAHHFTKLIGGVRWEALPESAARSPAPPWTGLVVSIALQELAARIGPSSQDGIDGRIEVNGASILIVLGAPHLTEASCSDIVGELGFLLNGVALLDVTADGPTIRLKL